MAFQLSPSVENVPGRRDLSEVRQEQQQKHNEDAKIAESIRKEKERQKLKEKLERYERLGWKIFGPTCEPRQEYRTENAKAKMDQKMSEARSKMQKFHDKKIENMKSKDDLKPDSDKQELENQRKKALMFRTLKLVPHPKKESNLISALKMSKLCPESSDQNTAEYPMEDEHEKTMEQPRLTIVPKILKLRPPELGSENMADKSNEEEEKKRKEIMDKEMKEARLRMQQKIDEASQSIKL